MVYKPYWIWPRDLWLYQQELHQVQVSYQTFHLAASSHDALVSGIYQRPNICKSITFQDSAFLSGPQKTNKSLKSVDNELYALRAEKNERSRRQYKPPGR